MKHSVFVFILLAIAQQSLAQQPLISLTERKNEIGLASRNTINSAYKNYTGLELIGKRWKNKWQAYRIGLGINFEDYTNPRSLYSYQQDSVIEKKISTVKRYATLSLGLEAERHFYGKIYLFGALDTRFMYGKGETNENITKYGSNFQENNFINHRYYNLLDQGQVFKWDILPSIGAKLKFNRICFGLEACTHFMSLETENGKKTNSNSIYFDVLSNYTQRIFMTYRF